MTDVNILSQALDVLKIKDYFDFYLSYKDVESGNIKAKPAPDIYLKACEEIDVKPENAIVCEDAPNGIIAAYRSGAKPVMVIDRIEPTDEIRKLLFVNPLNTLAEVKEIISNKK